MRFNLAAGLFGAVSCALLASASAQALTLSSAELRAAERLGCVLADDALGYLSEDQFNRRFDESVAEFADEQVDVIYAKALGYIDGLLFGVPAGDPNLATRRLESYSHGERCANAAGGNYSTVSTTSV